MRAAAGFIVGSRPEADRIRGRYGLRSDRVHVIPNPVPLSEWPVGDRGDARRQLGLPDTAFVAAWHGRVELRRKGIDLMLEAWSRLEHSGPTERTLLMVGTGPDAAEVHSTVDSRGDVAWTDAYELDRSRIRLHLAAADLALLPSRHEGFPVALLEMMASGRPVVTADVPGVGDIAPRGEQDGCVIVPVDDAAALSLAIRDLSRADERRHRLGRAGRQRVGTEFSFETVGRLLAAAFDDRPRPAG
jgi:glycosyltransferase involved in cell wall biosynthesis